ncbi:hypothetical protein D3C74_413120 [compost metagenome]
MPPIRMTLAGSSMTALGLRSSSVESSLATTETPVPSGPTIVTRWASSSSAGASSRPSCVLSGGVCCPVSVGSGFWSVRGSSLIDPV